ncbi:hypothetical protein [Micromonospora sp. IBSANI012]|uniref:hypothetical protein n=1 Tax=Micromonospora sp. IBSANI012 TaxID=3457761 RepID=UPI004059382F
MLTTSGQGDHAFDERTDEDTGAHQSLSEGEVREFRRAHLAKSAASDLRTDELAAELRRLSGPGLPHLQRMLKVRLGAPMTVVAQSMRTWLARANEYDAANALHNALLHGVGATALTAELTERELAGLLEAEPSQLGFLSDAEIRHPLLDSGQFGSTARVRAAIWSSMVSTGHAGSVAALGWLIAEPPAAWSDAQRQLLVKGWQQVRQRLPLLPEQPAPLSRLIDVAAVLQWDGDLDLTAPDVSVSTDEADEVDFPEGDPSSPSVPGDEVAAPPEELTVTAEQCDAVEAELEDVRRDDLPALVQALEAGAVPPDAGLDRIVRLAQTIKALFEQVVAITGGAVPVTLEEARTRLDDRLAAASTQDLLTRIRRLTSLSAPEYASAEAAQASHLASTVDADTDSAVLAGLDALVSAIEIGRSDPAGSAEQARIVQTALPHLSVLVMVAMSGALTFSDKSQEVDGHRDDEADEHGPEQDESPPDPPPFDLSPPPVHEPVDEPDEPDATSLEEVIAGLNLTVPAPAGVDSTPERMAPLEVVAGADAGVDTDSNDRGESVPEGEADVLYASLLRDRHLALASWLLTALDAPAPIIAAHRLVAYAAAMRTSAGANAAAFADTVRQLDAAALRDRHDIQMLVYAASVRAGLLSPTAGAAGPLRDLTNSIVKSGPAVEELTEALLGAIYNGAYLTARSTDAIAEAAEAEQIHESLAREARAMLQSAPSRTIRYQAATELWQAWMAPNGYLGAPLTAVADGSRSPEQVNLVRDRVRELRSKSSLSAALDRDTRRVAAGKRNRGIEARARDKILDWTNDVTDLLTRWVEATESLTETAAGTWMADPMADLRVRVNGVRSQAVEQLRARARSGDVIRDAAIETGLALLTESLALLDGSITLSGAEVPADRLIGSALALAPDLPLTATLEPAREVTVGDVAAAVEALQRGAAGWTEVFDRRASRHDQVGTQVLIDALRPSDPQLAQRLSAARDRAVIESTEQLDARVAKLAGSIDSDRRFGRMTADQWADLSARARAYTTGARGLRRDFDVMLQDVAELEQERAEVVHAAIASARQQLEGHTLAEGVHSRIAGRINEGDLTTANEYLETVRSGRSLPGPRDDAQHLHLFYPTFPTLFARSSGNARTSPLVELRRAMDDGRNPAEGALAEALTAARIDLSQNGRLKNAASRIGQWTALSESKSLDAKLGNVKAVLEQLGFFVDIADTPSTRRGQAYGRSSWMHLSGVRATAGRALIPAFGSAISPSGNSLRVLAVWRSPTAPELVELLRAEPADHSVVVLYFGALDLTARRELAHEFRNGRKLPVTAVVDEAAFAYLVAQPEPGRDITMAITLPFTSATPFTPDVAGLVPQEMFYGRAEERDKVVDMMGSCIVYGGRQLGKSALLRAAAREFDDGEVRHAVYQSIYRVGQANPVDAVWTALWPQLADKGIVPRDIPSGDVAPVLTQHVARWISGRSGRQLLVLLDESDSFLDADATDGRFTHVTHFKELMEVTGRAVKVVFAGLHQTARFERLANHPLAHFGDPVCVGPLAPQPAYDLLSRPLQALGYQFVNHDDASRVLALANNQPALIQLFGAQLLRDLRRTPLPAGAPPQKVTRDDVEAVWADSSLRNSFRKRFDWTLNLDPRYKIIAYSVAFHAHAHGAAASLTPAQLRSECEQWWPKGFAAEDVRTGEFRALLDECVDLGVLAYANGAYRLRTPNVLDLLGSRDEVDEFLEQAESTPLPESFDGSLMRPAFGRSATRAPLNSQQIADLLAARSKVRLIAGSAALTVERCISALKAENDNAASGSRRSHIREATAASLRTACQRATLRAAGGHAVVLVDLTTASLDSAHDAWRTARELIAAHSGGSLGIVLVTSPAQAPLWPVAARESDASSGITGLRRYDRTDLRLWLTDTTLPFQDDASRSELLAVTGGWPINVNKVVEDLSRDQDAYTRHDPLRQLRAQLADPANAEALVVSSGVRSDRVLREAWRFLVTEFGADRADADTVADYLAMHGDSGEAGSEWLASPRLQEAGYQSALDVVEVMRTLGLLVSNTEDGQLLVEPVMAAATRTAQG